jgi:hypothetical protein
MECCGEASQCPAKLGTGAAAKDPGFAVHALRFRYVSGSGACALIRPASSASPAARLPIANSHHCET